MRLRRAYSVRQAICLHQFQHLGGAGAGSGLVGHRGHPLDEAGLEERGRGHHHQADGAVAADEGAQALGQAVLDARALTGSRMMTASSLMRSVEAASIQ